MTRHRTSAAVLGTLTLTAGLVAAFSSPSSARVVEGEAFHDEFSGTIENFCDAGIDVDFEGSVDGRYRVVDRGPHNELDFFMERTRIVQVFTDQLTGQQATDIQPGTLNKDLKLTDNGDGTITIIVLATGGARTYGDSGQLIARNSGQVRFRIVYDYVNDVEKSNDLIFGSTGTNDDFCAAILEDWGY
jgi:hypothetical protein